MLTPDQYEGVNTQVPSPYQDGALVYTPPTKKSVKAAPITYQAPPTALPPMQQPGMLAPLGAPNMNVPQMGGLPAWMAMLRANPQFGMNGLFGGNAMGQQGATGGGNNLQMALLLQSLLGGGMR